MELQFDGKAIRKDSEDKPNLNYSSSGKYNPRHNSLGRFVLGRGVRFFWVASIIWSAGRVRTDNSDPIGTFITSVITYVLFGIIASIVLFVAMILVGVAIITDIATNDLGELFILLWQIFLVLIIIIAYLSLLGQQLASAGINMFVNGVWIKGWRGIIWRTFVAPLVGGFFVMTFAWLIVIIMRDAPLRYVVVVSALYVIPAYVITLTAIAFMFIGWISFWRHLRDYLYQNNDNVAFFILFAIFYPFPALTGFPFLVYIVRQLVNFTLNQYSTQLPEKEDIDFWELISQGAERLIRTIVEQMIALRLIDFIFGLIVILMVVITIVIGVFDIMQTATIIPQVLRDAMLKKLHTIAKYSPETSARINAMKLIIIYGSIFSYLVFGFFVIKYIIPLLFSIAIGII